MAALGAVLTGKGDHAEAEQLLLAAMEAFRADPKAPAFLRQECAANLASLYEAWDRPEEAAKWREAR